MEGYAQLQSSFNILLDSAHKLAEAMPYLGAYGYAHVYRSDTNTRHTESPLLTINNVAPTDMSIELSLMMNSSAENGELVHPF